MASFVGNNIHLSIDGVIVHADFKNVSIEPSVEDVDTTRGSGTEHRQRNTGLRDTSMTITLGYDTVRTQQQIQYLRPGRHTVIFGPEGAIAGKPKHQQDFITTSVPLEISVEKAEVALELTMVGADAPTYDMFDGATF